MQKVEAGEYVFHLFLEDFCAIKLSFEPLLLFRA